MFQCYYNVQLLNQSAVVDNHSGELRHGTSHFYTRYTGICNLVHLFMRETHSSIIVPYTILHHTYITKYDITQHQQ